MTSLQGFSTPMIRPAALALALAVSLAACGTSEPAETGSAAVEKEAGKCVLNPPAEPGMCTMDYTPVCGCDGKTYGNACMAAGAGVPSHTPGECEKDSQDKL